MTRSFVVSILLLSLSASTLVAQDRELAGGPSSPERRHLRHATAVAEHVLLPEDRARLASEGVEIVRELGGREYLIRSDASAKGFAASTLFASVEPLSQERKLTPGVVAELARFDARARLTVVFHDDVAFEDAIRALRSAGIVPLSPLQTTFGPVRSIDADIDDARVGTLVSQDEVFQIHPRVRQIKSMNAAAAALSSVPAVHSAPYDLSGAGVTVSVWDFPGVAEASHPEFQGRVTSESGSSVEVHATHVTGTIAAAGLNGAAKGMAPSAAVRSYPVVQGENPYTAKQANFGPRGVVADNNSWGFVAGWNYDSTKSSWSWFGSESFGAYSFDSVALDELSTDNATLIIVSAGNDNNDRGPTEAPHKHYHADESDSTSFCYSTSGSGSDCPKSECSRCEITRHPADGPYQTVGELGSAKNVVTVGALDDRKRIASFSSRGPSRDGRVKPEISAKGVQLTSTVPGGSYGLLSGTSMASPVITGISALLVEQWRRSFGLTPNSENLRAVLIAGAEDLGNVGPDYTFGFGLANARLSVDIIREDVPRGTRIRTGTIRQGETIDIQATFSGSEGRVVVAWRDPENVPYPERVLVNDIDVRVLDPQGGVILPYVLDGANPFLPATQGENRIDNVECVRIPNPSAGTYTVKIFGHSIASGPQSFTLASIGTLAPAVPPCQDSFEPNNSEATAWGRLVPGAVYTPVFCEATDVDFYRFPVDRAGPVSVTVTTGTAPVRLSLFANGVQVGSAVDINASSTRTISTSAESTPVSYVVKVEPIGSVSGGGAYTLRADFSSSIPLRGRPVRR